MYSKEVQKRGKNMKDIIIYFDLDGTVYDLYHVPNWLEKLRGHKPRVFKEGQVMFDKDFYTICEDLRDMFNVKFGVITLLPRESTNRYNNQVIHTKLDWIKKHLPFVDMSLVHIIESQEDKHKYAKPNCRTYLIDDNENNCKAWTTAKMRTALHVTKKFNVTDALLTIMKENTLNDNC